MLMKYKLSTKKDFAALRPKSLHMRLRKFYYLLLLILILHTLSMMYFEKLKFFDAFWLTFTSITTVGYGDLSAHTIGGRLTTIILIYIGGIAVLAQFAGHYFEYRQQRAEKMLRGDWRWQMKDHLVFLNSPEGNPEEYFYLMISELRESALEKHDIPIVIVTNQFPEGISDRLRELSVVHVRGNPLEDRFLEAASIETADTIVILSPSTDCYDSDSVVFDLAYRLQERKLPACLVAEVMKDENRKRLSAFGVDHVIRPIRIYPELLVRTIVAPGSECIIEDLFDSVEEECVRYNVSGQHLWQDVVISCLNANIGTPIGCLKSDGEIITSPEGDRQLDLKAIFVIVRRGNILSDREIQNRLQAA